MMKKNRIATRVKDKTGIAKSKNRSEELADLRSRYGTFSKNLKFLISTLNGNLEAMRAHSRSRLEVAKAVNALTVDTPLFKCAGDIPSHAIGTTDGGPPDDGGSGGGGGSSGTDAPPASYAAVHLSLHKKNKAYGTKYAEHIVAYATEWERILTTRITRHLKEYDKLRVDLDHYGRKVEDINKTHNKTMSKGKSVQEKGVDKLRRNEQKLVQARQEYDRFVNDLCTFLEEVLERGWKDLLPLLVKMGQFDATLCGEEHGLLRGSMAGVTAQMTEVASRFPGLNSQGRLKELETSSLESLARAHPSEREFNSGTLAIEQAPDAGETGLGVGGGGGLFGSLAEGSRDQLVPAPHHGTLSPLGADNPPRSRADTGDSGAYDWAAGGPVNPPPSSAPTSGNGAQMGMPRTGSGADVGSSQRMSSGSLSALRQDLSAQGLATGAMLATMGAAAPAPTLDDVFASSQRQTSSMSSQHSASRGSSSFGNDAFGGAGAANPPPQAPVPPPMMPPGPPPPPPTAAPPAPPQAGMAHMSLYPPAGGSGASASSNNPFDGAYGGGGGGRAPSSGGLPPHHPQLQQSFGQAGGVHSAPSTGGLPPQQQSQMMYGGQPQQSFGSGSSSTNPFG